MRGENYEIAVEDDVENQRMRNQLNVIYQSDENYAVFMGVSVYSLLVNNRDAEEITVYILDDGISERNKQRLSGMADRFDRKIVFLDIEEIGSNERVREFARYHGERKNKHSFYKLFLNQVLPADVMRVIYIDCDTLITGDLQELNETDLGACCIGMVYDALIYKAKKSLGLKLADVYYNSGVILFDMQKWRSLDCEEKMIENLKEHGQYGTVDQDVLNLSFFGQVYPLPMRYNVQPHHLDFLPKSYFSVYPRRASYFNDVEIEDAVKNPTIIHFLRYMGKSPWNTDNRHPAAELFDRYLAESPWKDYVKQDKKLSFAHKVEVLLYRILPKTWYLRIFVTYHEAMIASSNRNHKGKSNSVS